MTSYPKIVVRSVRTRTSFDVQDDENGWQLRVAPEREPAEERGDWARYAASEAVGGDVDVVDYLGEDLYYNTVTGAETLSQVGKHCHEERILRDACMLVIRLD